MNKVSAKVYYLIANGEVLLVMPEGTYIEMTNKEQDVKSQPALQGINIDEIDYIELEYGKLSSTFTTAVKSRKVNVESKELELTYFTEEELEEQRKQYDQQLIIDQELNTRISDIATYLLSSGSTAIADIENSILEIEKNKIINGGI